MLKKLLILIVLLCCGGYYYYQTTVKPAIDNNEYIQMALEALEGADFSEAENLLTKAYELSEEIPFDELKELYESGTVEANLTDALSALETAKENVDPEQIQDAIDLVESLKENLDDSSLLDDMSEDSISEALELLQ